MIKNKNTTRDGGNCKRCICKFPKLIYYGQVGLKEGESQARDREDSRKNIIVAIMVRKWRVY